jgi:hypothetical protein
VILLILLLLLGLSTLVLAAREVHLQRQLQREGIRVPGVVVRYGSSSAGTDLALFAVVGFTDVDGNPGEVKAAAGTAWPLGRSVPVIYPPGEASKARIDLDSERRSAARVYAVVGAGFTVFPIVMMALRWG